MIDAMFWRYLHRLTVFLLILGLGGLAAPSRSAAQPYDETQIAAYVDAAFEGMTKPIRKWPSPIVAKIVWPGCEDVADRILRAVTTAAHLEFRNISGSMEPNENFVIVGTSRPGEISKDEKIKKIFIDSGTTSENYEKMFAKLQNGGKVVAKSISDADGKRLYAINVVNRTIYDNKSCAKIFGEIAIGEISSFLLIDTYASSTGLSGEGPSTMDLAFISAIYDSSISFNEKPETAKPKILKLMTRALQGRK